MKKQLMMALCSLCTLLAWSPLPAFENAPARTPATEIEAKMTQKHERQQSEQAEFEKASEEEIVADEASADAKASLTNLGLFGLGGASTYTTFHQGAWHFATGVSGSGNHVFLEDGSGWMIAASDASKTLDWMGDDVIMVVPAPWYSYYGYVLFNNDTQVHVYADLKEKPSEYNIYSLWITAINPEAGTLTLSDKTVWTVPYNYDRNLMKEWRLDQKVLIGINGADSWLDKWITKKAPNILISVESGIDGYIKAKCEY